VGPRGKWGGRRWIEEWGWGWREREREHMIKCVDVLFKLWRIIEVGKSEKETRLRTERQRVRERERERNLRNVSI